VNLNDGNPAAVPGFGEAEIADFLVNNPGFFERHAELLASIQLASPHGQRAVSLQERQMQMLRDRIRGLEARIMDMIRHGQENVAIAERLHRWTLAVLLTQEAAELPMLLLRELQQEFLVPQAALRLWSLAAAHPERDWAREVGADLPTFAASLSLPYCGVDAGFEAVRWLPDAATIKSTALIPLRRGALTFGLLVLGSPDPTRFAAEMGTEFLGRIGDLASAGLARLLPAG
jgi:uncharacterized protein YigA (DUF484 family)